MSAKDFHRIIFFTKVPIIGFYRYKDEFQFFPAVLENQPESKHKTDFPNILEYWTNPEEEAVVPEEFIGLEDLYSTTVKTTREHNRILSLLSGISNNLFFTYENMDGNWGVPMNEDDLESARTAPYSRWCFKLLIWPEMTEQLKIDNFTAQEIAEIERVPYHPYYTYDPNLDFDRNKSLVLPDKIDDILDAYYSLKTEFRYYIDTTLSYNKTAVELWKSRKTLSLLSSFTAMETMVNLEYRDDKPNRCDSCNQLRYSVSRKFRDFLLKYIGDSPSNKKKFNQYYALRSKIVHTGRQLQAEKLFAEIPDSEREEEYLQRIEILQIGKLIVVNWLMITKKMEMIIL